MSDVIVFIKLGSFLAVWVGIRSANRVVVYISVSQIGYWLSKVTG